MPKNKEGRTNSGHAEETSANMANISINLIELIWQHGGRFPIQKYRTLWAVRFRDKSQREAKGSRRTPTLYASLGKFTYTNMRLPQ